MSMDMSPLGTEDRWVSMSVLYRMYRAYRLQDVHPMAGVPFLHDAQFGF